MDDDDQEEESTAHLIEFTSQVLFQATMVIESRHGGVNADMESMFRQRRVARQRRVGLPPSLQRETLSSDDWLEQTSKDLDASIDEMLKRRALSSAGFSVNSIPSPTTRKVAVAVDPKLHASVAPPRKLATPASPVSPRRANEESRNVDTSSNQCTATDMSTERREPPPAQGEHQSTPQVKIPGVARAIALAHSIYTPASPVKKSAPTNNSTTALASAASLLRGSASPKITTTEVDTCGAVSGRVRDLTNAVAAEVGFKSRAIADCHQMQPVPALGSEHALRSPIGEDGGTPGKKEMRMKPFPESPIMKSPRTTRVKPFPESPSRTARPLQQLLEKTSGPGAGGSSPGSTGWTCLDNRKGASNSAGHSSQYCEPRANITDHLDTMCIAESSSSLSLVEDGVMRLITNERMDPVAPIENTTEIRRKFFESKYDQYRKQYQNQRDGALKKLQDCGPDVDDCLRGGHFINGETLARNIAGPACYSGRSSKSPLEIPPEGPPATSVDRFITNETTAVPLPNLAQVRDYAEDLASPVLPGLEERASRIEKLSPDDPMIASDRGVSNEISRCRSYHGQATTNMMHDSDRHTSEDISRCRSYHDDRATSMCKAVSPLPPLEPINDGVNESDTLPSLEGSFGDIGGDDARLDSKHGYKDTDLPSYKPVAANPECEAMNEVHARTPRDADDFVKPFNLEGQVSSTVECQPMGRGNIGPFVGTATKSLSDEILGGGKELLLSSAQDMDDQVPSPSPAAMGGQGNGENHYQNNNDSEGEQNVGLKDGLDQPSGHISGAETDNIELRLMSSDEPKIDVSFGGQAFFRVCQDASFGSGCASHMPSSVEEEMVLLSTVVVHSDSKEGFIPAPTISSKQKDLSESNFYLKRHPDPGVKISSTSNVKKDDLRSSCSPTSELPSPLPTTNDSTVVDVSLRRSISSARDVGTARAENIDDAAKKSEKDEESIPAAVCSSKQNRNPTPNVHGRYVDSGAKIMVETVASQPDEKIGGLFPESPIPELSSLLSTMSSSKQIDVTTKRAVSSVENIYTSKVQSIDKAMNRLPAHAAHPGKKDECAVTPISSFMQIENPKSDFLGGFVDPVTKISVASRSIGMRSGLVSGSPVPELSSPLSTTNRSKRIDVTANRPISSAERMAARILKDRKKADETRGHWSSPLEHYRNDMTAFPTSAEIPKTKTVGFHVSGVSVEPDRYALSKNPNYDRLKNGAPSTEHESTRNTAEEKLVPAPPDDTIIAKVDESALPLPSDTLPGRDEPRGTSRMMALMEATPDVLGHSNHAVDLQEDSGSRDQLPIEGICLDPPPEATLAMEVENTGVDNIGRVSTALADLTPVVPIEDKYRTATDLDEVEEVELEEATPRYTPRESSERPPDDEHPVAILRPVSRYVGKRKENQSVEEGGSKKLGYGKLAKLAVDEISIDSNGDFDFAKAMALIPDPPNYDCPPLPNGMPTIVIATSHGPKIKRVEWQTALTGPSKLSNLNTREVTPGKTTSDDIEITPSWPSKFVGFFATTEGVEKGNDLAHEWETEVKMNITDVASASRSEKGPSLEGARFVGSIKSDESEIDPDDRYAVIQQTNSANDQHPFLGKDIVTTIGTADSFAKPNFVVGRNRTAHFHPS